MSIDVTNFGLAEKLRCGIDLRALISGADSFESAAVRVCDYFLRELTGPEGDRACALVRCYKTHSYGELEPALKRLVGLSFPGEAPRPSMKCLTLMATAGEQPEWNSRKLSKGHKAIPLPSPDIVEQAPMIAQLIREFGLDLSAVVDPGTEVVRDLMGKTYGVFFVREARGSRFIPAQEDFVLRYGIRSVVGFGGSLPRGDLFAIILFAKVSIPESSTDRFRALALDVKSGFFNFKPGNTFAR